MGKIGIYDPKGLGPPVLMNMLKDQRMVIEQAAFKNILCRMGHLASHRKQTKHISIMLLAFPPTLNHVNFLPTIGTSISSISSIK